MDKFFIVGGNRLVGEVEVDACKNSILPIMAGSILCGGRVVLKKCPHYIDVEKMCDILRALGSVVSWADDKLILDNSNLKQTYISHELTKDIRASIFTLGAMIARFGHAQIAYPGGCFIGERGVDIHLSALESFGVNHIERHGYIYAERGVVKNREIFLKNPSVGATENAIMFACASVGEFWIYNPAKEPEIVDLQNFLNKMGARIFGAGTNCIHICGVKNFHSVTFSPMPDRIIAGTLLIAGAMTKGDLILKNADKKHNEKLCEILSLCGAKIEQKENTLKLSCEKLRGFGRVETGTFPQFPTDLQSQLTALATVANGTSLVKENIFENRFQIVPELKKMGAKIVVENNLAVVEGGDLSGSDVYATDLRGGVALVLAGLVANGYTTVHNVFHIDRGYFQLEKILSKLGADIKRIKN